MGLLAKIRIVALGSAHDLLDKAIDLNSPSALRQYVRDLEDALDKLRNEAAVQAGQVRTMTRELGDLQHNIETETELVKRILAGTSPNKDTIARTKGTAIVGWQKEIPQRQQELEDQKKAATAIDEAVAKLDAKHTQMVQRVRELERIDRQTKAKESAASALSSSGGLVSGGVDISIDSVEQKMRARKDVADEKFDRAMGTVAVEEDPTQQADVDDFLNNLKNKAS